MFRRQLEHPQGALQQDLKLNSTVMECKSNSLFISVFLHRMSTVWVSQSAIKTVFMQCDLLKSVTSNVCTGFALNMFKNCSLPRCSFFVYVKTCYKESRRREITHRQ